MFGVSNLKRAFNKISRSKNGLPKTGRIRFGDFSRTEPFSRKYGFDRGGAIDRVYIERFLEDNQKSIRGRVLEVANNAYTIRFGGSRVTQSDILYIDDSNPKATIIADLGKPLTMAGDLFDCIILTQTLQFIYDFEKAIDNCYELLRPGGCLLLTVPGISHIGKDPFNWYWSFTTYSIKEALSKRFEVENIKQGSFGNVLIASAFLFGLGKTELKKGDYDVNDPQYQVIVTALARK